MPKDRTRRLKPSILDTDRESLTALSNVPSYSPANPAYSLVALNTLRTEMLSTQAATETQAMAAAAVARDAATAAE